MSFHGALSEGADDTGITPDALSAGPVCRADISNFSQEVVERSYNRSAVAWPPEGPRRVRGAV